jgi:2-oxoglutarate dehydrogenase E2 component (dihydrolipoamide succinyltransferase)
MGESVAEGTVVRWIKKVGESVDRDEPLFEISTDKVDAEIPSPAAGVLTEIRVSEGQTVPVDSVVAIIGTPGEATASASAGAATAPSKSSARGASAGSKAGRSKPDGSVPAGADGDSRPANATSGSAATRANAAADTRAVDERLTPEAAPMDLTGEESRDEVRRTRSSPLVRRIAKEHHVDITALHGSGIGGRVTKQDILQHLDSQAPAPADGGARPAPATRPGMPAFEPGEQVEVVPMSVMRKKIAEHMVFSRHTSAHVHSVFEIDFHRVSQLRGQRKADYERFGVKLTFMAFIAKAVVDALRAVPVVNASIDGDNIVYKKDINLGIAVALDWGLIVPVIRHADEKNLLGLSRSIADLAERARTKQLKPEEVQGGTFTITNPGTFGTLFGMPIINQPQVAILGVGAIEKRVVVIDDAIHVRPRAYLSLGYDHRLVDGAVADQFMSHVKQTIENFDPAAV